MDDPKRTEKLNAARKLLKEHQKKSKKPTDSSQLDNEKSASVTHISEAIDGGTGVRDTDNSSIQSLPNLTHDNETCSIPSSKGSSTNISSFFNQDTPSEPQHFFDQIPQHTNHARNPQSNGFTTTPPYGQPDSFVPNQPQLPAINGQTLTDSAHYHQYFNLYNDALQKIQWYEQQMEATKAMGEQRLNQAVNEFQEKMQFQCRSIEMALTEKTDLQRQLHALQEENKAKAASCEELTNRLKASRNHVSRLEKELSDVQEARTQHNSILKKLETSVQEHKVIADRYRSELDEAKQEIEELKKSLDSAGSEHSALEKKLAEKESQLSLALIKIQQLGNGSPQSIVSQTQDEEHIEMLRYRISDLIKENEQSSLQYQEYINNLNVQLQETTAMYESAVLVKEEQLQRISSLVEHVSDLEKQIQKHASIAAPSASDIVEQYNQLKEQLETSNKKMSEMQSSFEMALAQEKAKLEEVTSQLTESRNEVGLLEDRLERLSGEVPDAKLLQAAMESDKVAAARAISQNTQLKQQLQEIQDAYIKLQNTKLELTEQMEQLNHQCAGLQDELQRYIKKELQVSSQESSTEMNQVTLIDGCCQTTYYDLEAHKAGQSEMVTPEAAAMLEDKFRTTMNKLAQVLDEKQNLEHLVTKLQSETETIGEYVALYQMQRCKLEKREIEKDQIVAAISKEKEELRDKLAEITALIPSLVNRTPHVSVGEEATEEVKEVSNENTNEAASKIMSLLSEIGTSNLVSDHSQETCISTFHPCALCSGSLITV